MTRCIVAVSEKVRSPNCPTNKNPTFVPWWDGWKLQNFLIFLLFYSIYLQGTMSATKNKNIYINRRITRPLTNIYLQLEWQMGSWAPFWQIFLILAGIVNFVQWVAVDQAALSRVINFVRKGFFIEARREMPRYFYYYLAILFKFTYLEDDYKHHASVQRWFLYIFAILF